MMSKVIYVGDVRKFPVTLYSLDGKVWDSRKPAEVIPLPVKVNASKV